MLEYFREFHFASVLLRLVLAMVFGGVIGLEREFKHRPAGFRTYMLVCVGAALAMVLGQYEAEFLAVISDTATTDVSRFGAQCINGIGFLGAATILMGGHQEVKGLTTAAGLWASACMGLAIGAGFYECAVCAVAVIFICVRFLPSIEHRILEEGRNVAVYIEMRNLSEIEYAAEILRRHDIRICSMDFFSSEETDTGHAGVMLILKLPQREKHGYIRAALLQLPSVYSVEEI